MQQPAQLTAFTFHSAGQPVTQSQVALAHVTCDERGDSFSKQLADFCLAEVLNTTGGGGIHCACGTGVGRPYKGLLNQNSSPLGGL